MPAEILSPCSSTVATSDVQRLPGERHPFHRNGGLVAAEGRKTAVGVDAAGDVEEGAVELPQQVAREEHVGGRVDGEVGVDHVVLDEANTRGNLPRVNVGRGDSTPPIDEATRHLRPASDPHLEDVVVPREVLDRRLGRPAKVGHGGTFMLSAPIDVAMLVDIVPVGNVPAEVKRAASSALRSVYDCEVTIAESQSIPSGAYDAGRNQYCAENFIQLAERVGRGEKNIAITPNDLFYRRRNYVFGLAYLDGSGSVVSTYRLQTSSDGGFSNKSAADIFQDRVRKEIVHEIGHTYGLEHCDNQRCVMNFSPTVREVDIKEENLCGSCQRLID